MSDTLPQYTIDELRRFMARVYKTDATVEKVELTPNVVDSDTYTTAAAIHATVDESNPAAHRTKISDAPHPFEELFGGQGYEWERVHTAPYQNQEKHEYTVRLPVADDIQLTDVQYPS